MLQSDVAKWDNNNVLVFGRHGKFLCNRHDIYISGSLIKYGEFSELEGILLRKLCKPNNIILEIGANIGAHSVPLARHLGPEGKLFVFEPQPVLFQLLSKNLQINNLTNVTAYPYAASRTQTTMFMPEIDYSHPGNFGGVALMSEGEGVAIDCVRLDDVIDVRRLHLIKIDVEGDEQSVIEGAHNLIRHHRPILYVENDRIERSPDLIRCLFDLEYQLFWDLPPLYREDNFNGDHDNIFNGLVSVNMICIPKERRIGASAENAITNPDVHPMHRVD